MHKEVLVVAVFILAGTITYVRPATYRKHEMWVNKGTRYGAMF